MTRTRWGLVALALSFAVWGLVFALPFLEATPRTRWFLGAALYGVNWALVLVAIVLLGRPRYEALKARVLSFFRRDRGN